jgi:energy-coupling factor transporter ATP-binding protein EcfA2
VASDDVRALLITGTYGSGKSTLAEELAEVLEERAMAHAAIDLDWLMWFDVPGQTDAVMDAVFPANLAAVVANYVAAGVRYLVLAGAVRSQADLTQIREAVGHPIQVVRLHVPLEEIERRLAFSVTTGRIKDLRESPEVLADQEAADIDALDFMNDGVVHELALRVLAAIGWAR